MEEELITIASIIKRNGAYLISWDHHNSVSEDMTPNQLYDAASSRTVARRLARQGAVEMGFTDLRWAKDDEMDNYATDQLLGIDPDERSY